MNEINDWKLVEQAREGSEEAFVELVRRYQEPVVHFCYRMVKSVSDAEELAQDSFMRVYRHLGRLTPRAQFSTVLFGIARNLTLNHIRNENRRGRGRTRGIEPDEAIRDDRLRPDRQARVGEMDALLEQALGELSPDHREVLVLRELQGLDYAEIARICKCRKGTVKSRLARAREQLRERLIRLGGDKA